MECNDGVAEYPSTRKLMCNTLIINSRIFEVIAQYGLMQAFGLGQRESHRSQFWVGVCGCDVGDGFCVEEPAAPGFYILRQGSKAAKILK
ncbi:MAG: hypothetical protein K2K79_05930 [Paramuribaculum sp.]|nr:hypothetical protein [Paramuribaculum sp.]